jgi:2-phosphosulfolactate phosphatase
MPDAPGLYVHLLPAHLPTGGPRGGWAVVIDVLRATTVIARALASGVSAAIPCLEIEEARSLAAAMPPGRALLGGERGGLPIEGFDLGNSPADYTVEACRGRTLVITTTNGTRAVHACRGADRILAGSFANLAATAHALRVAWLAGRARAIHVVCAGTEGEVSLEDSLLAGALAHVLAHRGDDPIPLANDPARLVLAAAPRDFHGLPHQLREGQGGRNLVRLGLDRDIDDCARVDSVDVVPALDGRRPGSGFLPLRDP